MGPINSLWFKWKSLRLPWRKSFLVGMCFYLLFFFFFFQAGDDADGAAGQDLLGNTYWEFRETLNSPRLRRIVKYNRNVHYADVKISRTSLQPAPMLVFALTTSPPPPKPNGTNGSATCVKIPLASRNSNAT